jgi:hypothetical protein
MLLFQSTTVKAKFNSVDRYSRKPVYDFIVYQTWALKSYSYADVLQWRKTRTNL